ncbi:hypothetical protein CEXT_526251 [Caerostris extrusa]|uniref:Uncharacterized protein n=1 Tax=Caerostris extrusa TaxID=172846 RepID=A0AAV4PD26_CAEEX|nr:hypothetical protein CEXT_526251 [Caerostris extrusa]
MGIITIEPAKYRCALVFWNLFFPNVVIFLAVGQNNWIMVIPGRNSIRSVEKNSSQRKPRSVDLLRSLLWRTCHYV